MTKTFSFGAAAAAGLIAAAFLGFYLIALADSAGVSFEAPTYTVDSPVNGVDGWTSTGAAGGGCAVYDHEVSSSFGVPGFGAQSLRISNAVTSGCFGDQTFAKPLTDAAGEADSTDGAFSRGTLQNHFEAQFEIRAMQLSQQPGLFMSVSPDRGDGSRMSYLGFEDTPSGIDVIFYDTPGTGNPATFAPTTVATGLSRATTHTAKFVMDFVNGPSNDVVKIYIDGVLVHTGTSWENYFRFDTEASAEQSPRIVKTLLFRTGGGAAPSTAGLGYLIDNLSLDSSISAPPPPATLIVDDNLACPGAAYSTIQSAVTAANSGDTIQVCAGTYPEHVAVNKSLTLSGANAGIAGNGVRGAESIVDGTDTDAAFAITANNVTIDGFTVQNGSNGGLFSGIWSVSGTQNSSIVNNIITQNALGVWAQCGGNCLIENNLFDSNNKSGPVAGGISADSTTGLTINNNEFKNHAGVNPVLLQAVAPGAHTNVSVTNNSFHDNTDASVIYALAITGGTFTGNTILAASDVTGISFSGANTNVTVTNNVITGAARGVRVEDAGYYGGSGANSNITVNRNSLASDSEYGVGNTDAAIANLDGTCNWWGAVNGPGPVGPGSGSPVTTNVTFSSWLTSADLNGACNGPITLTTLTVVKTVTNNDGGTKVVSDFPLFIDGFSVTSGAASTTSPGAHTVSETSQAGYTAGTWGGDCAADGTITLALGENKTCTITNDDNIAPPPPPPANACATPTVAPAGYTLQNGTSASNNVTIAPFTMFVGKGGNDTVNGPAAGNYIVCTGSGSDTITLGNGDFTIAADGGNNTIVTGNGDGYISSGSASDKITTGDGAQTINADGGGNIIVTGNGDKNITTGSASDKITTGDGNDTINADGGSNNIKSGAGNDTITTGSASDTVDGGADTDTCNVGSGTNTVTNCELP